MMHTSAYHRRSSSRYASHSYAPAAPPLSARAKRLRKAGKKKKKKKRKQQSIDVRVEYPKQKEHAYIDDVSQSERDKGVEAPVRRSNVLELEDSRKTGQVERGQHVAGLDDSDMMTRSYEYRNTACQAWERAFQHAAARCAEQDEHDVAFANVLSSQCTVVPHQHESQADVIARETVLIASLSHCTDAQLFSESEFRAGDVLVRPLAKDMRRSSVGHPCVVAGAGVVVDLLQPYGSDELLQRITQEGRSAAFVRAQSFHSAKHKSSPVWRLLLHDRPTVLERFHRSVRAVNSVGPCWFHPIQATCWHHLSVWNAQAWTAAKVHMLPPPSA